MRHQQYYETILQIRPQSKYLLSQHSSPLDVTVLTDTITTKGDCLMAYHRKKLPKKKSKKLFSRTASKSHKKNSRGPRAMRGGYRI